MLLAIVVWIVPQRATAQFLNQQVGGVSIDARGIVTNVQIDELNRLKRERAEALQPVPGDLKARVEMRKVSLRQLEAAIAEHRTNGTPISDDMRYLAGLQRIQYVFVYPEHNDIVLAGPGEGWKVESARRSRRRHHQPPRAVARRPARGPALDSSRAGPASPARSIPRPRAWRASAS